MKGLSDNELFDIIEDLRSNTASRYAVAFNGWSRRVYPIQKTLQELWDAQERNNFILIAANSKKKPKEPNTYPNAWEQKVEKVKDKKVLTMTATEARQFYTGLVKKRDPSVSKTEIIERNKEFTTREKMQNGNGPQK